MELANLFTDPKFTKWLIFFSKFTKWIMDNRARQYFCWPHILYTIPNTIYWFGYLVGFFIPRKYWFGYWVGGYFHKTFWVAYWFGISCHIKYWFGLIVGCFYLPIKYCFGSWVFFLQRKYWYCYCVVVYLHIKYCFVYCIVLYIGQQYFPRYNVFGISIVLELTILARVCHLALDTK